MKKHALKVIEVYVIETPLFEKMTEDGIGHFYNFNIVAMDRDHKEYTLSGRVFEDREEARRLASKINRAQEINLDYWHEGTCWDQYKTMWTPEEERRHAYENGYA